VPQDIHRSAAIVRLRESFFHLLYNFDSRLEIDKTMINT
jgi:hypothetical protein